MQTCDDPAVNLQVYPRTTVNHGSTARLGLWWGKCGFLLLFCLWQFQFLSWCTQAHMCQVSTTPGCYTSSSFLPNRQHLPTDLRMFSFVTKQTPPCGCQEPNLDLFQEDSQASALTTERTLQPLKSCFFLYFICILFNFTFKIYFIYLFLVSFF